MELLEATYVPTFSVVPNKVSVWKRLDIGTSITFPIHVPGIGDLQLHVFPAGAKNISTSPTELRAAALLVGPQGTAISYILRIGDYLSGLPKEPLFCPDLGVGCWTLDSGTIFGSAPWNSVALSILGPPQMWRAMSSDTSARCSDGMNDVCLQS